MNCSSNMDELISIVVPVYNVEQFLEECIESLLKQTYQNIEILLINDGSTDKSYEICLDYQKKDNRIQVFNKENEGLGLTRNFGIRHAHGKYICFLDSDDYLYDDALESMHDKAVISNADIISANTIYKDEPMKVSLDEGEYDKKAIRDIILNRIMGNYPGKLDAYTYTSTAKLFKLETLLKNNIEFPSERKLIWEDLAFSSVLYPICDKIVIMHKPVYYYRFNGSSLTHKYVPQKFEKIITMYKYMCEAIKKLGLDEESEIRLNNNFLGHIRTCIKLEVFYSNVNGRKYALQQIKKMCSDSTVNEIVDSIPFNTYNSSQALYSVCIKKRWILMVYILTWFQNKRKRID